MTETSPDLTAVPGVTRWRKRPVTIDAMHWDGTPSGATAVVDWILAGGGTARYHDELPALRIDTLEGTMTAPPGSWVIRGVAGEFYRCDPVIFGRTYEPVDHPGEPAPGDLAEQLHALAKKRDATAARNQRNGQSLIDQGDAYGEEGLAIAEAPGACVVDLRAVLADAVNPTAGDYDHAAELLAAQAERDKAYRERAALVAYLSANYPAEIVEAPGAFADPWPVAYVDTPSGQMTWHIARADLDLFGHLRRVIDAAPGWDGHTTDEKYRRLRELTRTVATGIHGPQSTADLPGPAGAGEASDHDGGEQ